MKNLEARLRGIVPANVNQFQKLDHGEPYHYDRWGKDAIGHVCLYYWFSSNDGRTRNVKRVPVNEVGAALNHILLSGRFGRQDFRQICPLSNSDGPCGFAVVGRLLESLGVAQYVGRNQGFVLLPG
jgi:hypothetical protein